MSMKKKIALIGGCLIGAFAAAGAAASQPCKDGAARAVVTDADADWTGKTDSTAAIQKCIDRVSAAGGGTVVFPPGEYRILYLSLRPRVRLELAGGAERATDGWTPEVAARVMDPSRSAIIRSAANRKGHWSIFLYNLVPRTDATNGVVVVKDIPNNHALQIDGCEDVVVTNCLFAGYRFGGEYKCLTRETIQVEQTSPGAIGDPKTSPVTCPKEISIPNRNVSVTGCWFGPSERLGPHLIALGHHGGLRSCNGLVFAGNVVVNPLYCGLRLANVSDVLVESNTFISTKKTERLANDSAIVCLWGRAALKPGEKGVVVRGNKVTLSKESPLRRLWVSSPRAGEVSMADGEFDFVSEQKAR